jgi:hypothetical protein
MTGGPNSHKHPIDYEFSQYDRNELIYKFAKDVDEEKLSKYFPQKEEAKA